MTETQETVLDLLPCPFCGGEAEFERKGTPRHSTIVRCTDCSAFHECGEEWDHGRSWNTRAALSRAPKAGREGAAERLAIVAEKPARLIRWGEGDRLDLQSVLAALSPPSTGGEGEALIMRVGERIADEVEKVAAGRQSNCEQAARDIVGWLHPSPEMGEISREEMTAVVRQWVSPAWCSVDRLVDAILSKLKENGLSREELGGSAQSLPSGDAQERSPVPPLSDGEGQ